ncbi:MAG TPA: FAD-dependent oxidoreductase [Mycobacteriales bacterium]|nr:FAD-dependent oxidoreductase [Mycobacteriales bacterium]
MYDVAVIGAGVQGASAALHLAERGADVLLIDKDVPASGPTGRSSAVLRGYYVNEFLARATRESMDLFANFTEWTHGGEARPVTCGALFLHGDEDADKLRAACDRLNALGTVTSVLSRDDLASEFPMFDLDGIGWGVWEPNAGHADPAGTTNGMANRAVQLGATLRRHTRIAGIQTAPNGYVLKTKDGESFEAAKILIAAGPWTSQLLEMIDVSVPLWAERHIIATYAWGDAPHFPFVWASIPDGIYVKPELHAQYLVGTLLQEPKVNPDDFDQQLAPEEQVRITAATLNRFPALEDSEALSGYSALYDVAPDWQPVIGEVAPGAFVIAGTAGHGFKWAPAMGRHIADLVTGRPVDAGLAEFHPGRFNEGHHIDAGYGEARILG